MRQLFERVLADSPEGSRVRRSVAGAAITLIVLPIILGVMACLPVPVGDPERSRIDPSLTGVWMSADDEDQGLLVFAPFDRRSWLLLNAEISTPEDIAAPSPDDLHLEDLTLTGGTLSKAWLTTIRGARLMTWEPMLSLDDARGFTPELWFVFRVEHEADDSLVLRLINPDFDGLDEAQSRREAERIIRRNIDDPDLFATADETVSLFRVPQSEYGEISDLLDDMGLVEW